MTLEQDFKTGQGAHCADGYLGEEHPAEAALSLTSLKQKGEFSKRSEEAGVEKEGEGEGDRG